MHLLQYLVYRAIVEARDIQDTKTTTKQIKELLKKWRPKTPWLISKVPVVAISCSITSTLEEKIIGKEKSIKSKLRNHERAAHWNRYLRKHIFKIDKKKETILNDSKNMKLLEFLTWILTRITNNVIINVIIKCIMF